MQEKEIDTYLNKLVQLTDFEGEESVGTLYKIVDYHIQKDNCDDLAPISRGYYLVRHLKPNICYRKSHIKKIDIFSYIQ